MKALLALLITGCVGTFNSVPGDTSPEHTTACLRIGQKKVIGGTVAQAGIVGATALSSIAALTAKDHPEWAWKFGASAAITGATGAVGTYYGNAYAQQYDDICRKAPVK